MADPSSTTGYEFFEHTADVGLRIYGATLAELFARAAQGLTSLLIEDSRITVSESRTIALRAASLEELLRAWLNEVLFWFTVERFVAVHYELEPIEANELRGQVGGGRFDPTQHTAGTEVKGVTYHQFCLEQVGNRWEAAVILDV